MDICQLNWGTLGIPPECLTPPPADPLNWLWWGATMLLGIYIIYLWHKDKIKPITT